MFQKLILPCIVILCSIHIARTQTSGGKSQLGLKEIHREVPSVGDCDNLPAVDLRKCNLRVFQKFMQANLRYPADALETKKEGTVLITFTVTEKATLEKVHVSSGVSEGLDAEAMRLIKEGPVWKPALVNGKPVSQVVQMPIKFVLPATPSK